MEITRKLLAPIAIQGRDNRVSSVDLAAVLLRLFLFDTHIIQSIWLEDVILLQHSFGVAGLAELFESGALKFLCPTFTFGQTGQARSMLTRDHSQPGLRSLPFFQYQFSELRVQGAEEKLSNTLLTLDSGLRSELQRGRVVIAPEYPKTVFDGFYGDLKSGIIDSAVRIELRRMGIVPVAHRLNVDRTGNDEFAVDNDLSRRYQLPAAEAHRVIEAAMIAIGRMDDRIASMQAHSTLVDLNERDKTLLDAKLGLAAGLAQPKSRENEFSRVISLKGLPVPEYGSTVIDVKTLLKVRESDECRAFRDWLADSSGFSDTEIRERVAGMGARIRQAVHSKTGKAVRFLASNGIGLASGLKSPADGIVVGLAANIAESFIVEKLVPKDSIISFLTEAYPSVLRSPRKR